MRKVVFFCFCSIVSFAQSSINKMEYFVDSDPGIGSAINVPISSGLDVATSFNVSLSELTEGFHVISVRVKNADNIWSVTTSRPFVKYNIGADSPADIVAMEYFVDTDPGVGSGTAIPITVGQIVEEATFNVDVSGLSNGIHLLFVRAKNANNQWSITSVDNFTKKDNVVAIGSVPAAFCRETGFDVPFTVYGSFGASNVFTLQLSSDSGEFSSPTVLGTFTGNTSGIINATIPAGITVGEGYRLRIVASDPSDEEQPIKLFEVLAICPPPCATSISLQSTADDYSSGIVLKEVSSTNGIITAANKITGNAKVTYNAGRSVELQPGFTAANGTVFLVEMGGCVE